MISQKMSLLGMVLVVTGGCGRPEAAHLDSVSLTPTQALADFEALATTFRDLYGPMEFKEGRFGFKFESLVDQTRIKLRASTGDADTYGALAQFIGSFHDGHLNIAFADNASHFSTYDLPVYVAAVEGRAIVVKADLTDHLGGGVAINDELVAIDGKKPLDLLPILSQYSNLATATSTNYLLMQVTHRPFYVKELVPTMPWAVLEFVRPDQTHYQLEVPWVKTPQRKPDPAFAVTRSEVKNFRVRGVSALFSDPATPFLNFGSAQPFFATANVTQQMQWTPVALTQASLDKYKVTPAALKDIYAATYTYKAKHILLIRQPSYDTSTQTVADRMNAYRAILDQYQAGSDVLVVDQTHNPGGDLDYVAQFFSLFARGPALSMVEHLHADRKWIFDLQTMADAAAPGNTTSPGTISSAEQTQYQFMAAQVDAAIDAGQPLTTPMPLTSFNELMPDRLVTWTKPLLVLTDEMAGSCGDIFPMLIQRNHIAKLFGEATMGLGGNVDDGIITLPNSQATVDMTRGLYTTYQMDGLYQDADLVENVGVKPDYAYDHKVDDVRSGFIGYVMAFSDAAIAQLK